MNKKFKILLTAGLLLGGNAEIAFAGGGEEIPEDSKYHTQGALHHMFENELEGIEKKLDNLKEDFETGNTSIEALQELQEAVLALYDSLMDVVGVDSECETINTESFRLKLDRVMEAIRKIQEEEFRSNSDSERILEDSLCPEALETPSEAEEAAGGLFASIFTPGGPS